jgi:DNA repair exonuclease SbcCD ATPase subunit
MSKGLSVVSIDIKNIMGVAEATITPDGNVIEITGKNGSGKSSMIEAIKGALGISEHSTLLRNGEKKGQVVLDCGDMLIRRVYTPSGSKLDIQGKVMGSDDYSSLTKPAAILKNMINPNSVNPVQLLTARPKELLDFVLQAIPMVVDSDYMTTVTNQGPWDTESHALAVIGGASKDFTEKRRDANRDLKSAETTSDQLKATIPDDLLDEQEINDKIAENISAIEDINRTARKAGRTARTKFSEEIEEKSLLVNDLEDKLTDLQLEIFSAKEALALVTQRSVDAADNAMDKTLESVDSLQLENEDLHKDLTRIAVYNNTKRQVDEWKKKALTLGQQVNLYNTTLTMLQSYKEKLCEDLPIKGLAITDGMLSMNGVAFGMMNTASKVDLVIELAKLSAGKLGIIVLDDAEHLDTDTYNLFIEKARQTDLTFVVARVADQDISIK